MLSPSTSWIVIIISLLLKGHYCHNLLQNFFNQCLKSVPFHFTFFQLLERLIFKNIRLYEQELADGRMIRQAVNGNSIVIEKYYNSECLLMFGWIIFMTVILASKNLKEYLLINLINLITSLSLAVGIVWAKLIFIFSINWKKLPDEFPFENSSCRFEIVFTFSIMVSHSEFEVGEQSLNSGRVHHSLLQKYHWIHLFLPDL